MAPLIIVLGSVLGFIGAILGWTLFELSFLSGLAIWIASGPISAVLAFLANSASASSKSSSSETELLKA